MPDPDLFQFIGSILAEQAALDFCNRNGLIPAPPPPQAPPSADDRPLRYINKF